MGAQQQVADSDKLPSLGAQLPDTYCKQPFRLLMTSVSVRWWHQEVFISFRCINLKNNLGSSRSVHAIVLIALYSPMWLCGTR